MFASAARGPQGARGDGRFADRADAGRQLAAALRAAPHLDDAVVLAMPRGGVPVAAEVAARLHAPLDVVVVRKIGAPSQPELAVGAVAEGAEPLFDDDLIARLGLTRDELAPTVAAEQEELTRRLQHYRGGRPPLAVEGRTVVIVDDGLATGSSALAAVRAVRSRDPGSVVLAVPVAAPESLERLRTVTDHVVAVKTPAAFVAVGRWYDDFRQTSDEEVVAVLASAASDPG